MSLFATHCAANFVVTSEEVQTFSKRYVQGTWSWVYLQTSGTYSMMCEYHRVTKWSAKFVGMTLAAAKACRDALVGTSSSAGSLSRSVPQQYWNGEVTQGAWVRVDGTAVTADVSVSSAGGDAWDVVVSVSDDDVRYMKPSAATSAKDAFTGWGAGTSLSAIRPTS